MELASIQDHFSTIIYRTAASYHISRMMTQQTVQLWEKKKARNQIIWCITKYMYCPEAVQC